MAFQGRLIAPYQREGVQWMVARETPPHGLKGGFLCDEMGLGKTIQIIATMLINIQPKTLIVVPKTIVHQWKEEIAKFAPHLAVYLYDGPRRFTDPQEFAGFQVVIAPYSLIATREKEQGGTPLHAIKWSRVIMDEGHEIRTRKTSRHKAALLLKSDIRWIVSGTPVFNSMKDFVNLCAFIGLDRRQVQARTQEIRETFVIRRTKVDVSEFNQRLALPPCEFENIDIEMYPEEKKLYMSVFDKNKKKIQRLLAMHANVGMHQMHILESLLRIRQLMIHPQLYFNGMARKYENDPEEWKYGSKKLETLVELITKHPAEKTLIFCLFIEEMDFISKHLENENVFRIDGSVTMEDRIKQISQFKQCEGGAIFLIQIKAGGQGLNLQEATRVYITAPSWNPATELQAIARSHRTGQTQKVYVKKLVCVGDEEEDFYSVEQAIMLLQGHKSKICAEVLNDQRLAGQIPITSKSQISLGDILNIFNV